MTPQVVSVMPIGGSGTHEVTEETMTPRSPSPPSSPTGTKGSEKVENADRKKNASLPSETVEYLKAWMMSPEHVAHPYPTEEEKRAIMSDTGIELKQLTNWFVNNRKRYWKPRVEARMKQQREQQAKNTSVVGTAANTTSVVIPAVVSPTPRDVIEQEYAMVGVSSSSESDYEHPVMTSSPPPRLVFPTAMGISWTIPPAAVSVSDSSQSPSYDGGSDASINSSSDELDDIQSTTSSQGTVSGAARGAPQASVTLGPSDDAFCDKYGNITRKELVDVHILKPNHETSQNASARRTDLPSIKDVTILSPKEEHHVLRSYLRCPISYNFHKMIAGDRKKVQSRRDAEIVRIKKSYLRLYLFDIGAGTLKLTTDVNTNKRSGDHLDDEEHSQSARQDKTVGHTAAVVPPSNKIMRSQSAEDVATCAALRALQGVRLRAQSLGDKSTDVASLLCQKEKATPWSNYALQNSNIWRSACHNASHGYDESLPTLDEATKMFGYSRS